MIPGVLYEVGLNHAMIAARLMSGGTAGEDGTDILLAGIRLNTDRMGISMRIATDLGIDGDEAIELGHCRTHTLALQDIEEVLVNRAAASTEPLARSAGTRGSFLPRSRLRPRLQRDRPHQAEGHEKTRKKSLHLR